MNKCTHWDKISKFCVTEGCPEKQAGVCESCAAKFHDHKNSHLLTELQTLNFIKKYDVDLSIKPKCRTLQEKIYKYFNSIKNEIANFIDSVSMQIVNEIGHPFLAKKKLLTTYKRLKKKEYRKIEQKDFRAIYLVSKQISKEELIENQQVIFMERIKQNMNFIKDIEKILSNLERVVKQNLKQHQFYHNIQGFSDVSDLAQNIFHIINQHGLKNVANDSPLQLKEQKNKQKIIKGCGLETLENVMREKSREQISCDKKKNQEEVCIKQKSFSHETTSQMLKQMLKDNSDRRKMSTDNPDPRKLARLNSLDKEIVQPKKIEVKKGYENNFSQKNTKDDSQIKGSKEMEKFSFRIKDYYEQSENGISDKKRKPTYLSAKDEKGQEYPSEILPKKREKSFQSNQKKKKNNNEIKIIAQRVLPRSESKKKLYDQIDQVTQKTIIVPVDQKTQQIKAKETKNGYQYKKKQTKNPNKLSKQSSLTRSKTGNLNEGYHNLELTQSQQISVKYLVEARGLSAERAILLLEKAVNQAEENLSAAEYLSFLYLEESKPKKALDLCNKTLTKLQNSYQQKQMSLIMKNNKGAALNMLGRYSESILLLEECLQFKQTDRLYKNLGDAYFSIGIYEKTIKNYEKAIELNNKYDEAYYNLAVCFFLQQNYYQAKFLITTALQLSTKNTAYLQFQKEIQNRVRQF